MHCDYVQSMEFQELDPSMLLGFLLQSEQDISALERLLKESSPFLFTLRREEQECEGGGEEETFSLDDE